jgi:AraC-like DNA-binding protein
VWLPAAVAHAHQAYGATQLRTVTFGVHVNPLGLAQPTVLSVSRLHHSLTLLATGRSVTATAMTCGYSTPSAFTAAFRATFGTTPGAYRRDMGRSAPV